jgi:hypothetical protein
MKLRLIFCSAILMTLSLAAWPDTLAIIPSQPRYMEPVYVRIIAGDPANHIQNAEVTMSGSGIQVICEVVRDLPGSLPFDVMLGRFPAGTYSVAVNAGNPAASTIQFTVSAAPRGVSQGTPAVNYTDLWWNADESGWGLGIFQGPTNLIFATWFVYDAAGRPVWYTLQPGRWSGGKIYSGPIYKTTGTWFGGPFDTRLVTENVVGDGNLYFFDAQHASFRVTLEGITNSKQITRLPIE